MERKKLKIAALVHGYLPNHNAGAEAMLHQILINLKSLGYEVKVVTRDAAASEFEGIEIHDASNYDKMNEIMDWSDIIFTHLDFTKRAARYSKILKKPLVHLVHNDKQLAFNNIDSSSAQLAIANSEWISKTIKGINTLVVYPPTEPSHYTVKTEGDAITLLNMNEAKGGKIFWQLARIFPERNFIGVKGAYGEQIEYDKKLPNVTIVKNAPDVRGIYKKTRIVLMPSTYESWGRVGMEAACSGIPCIASPTPGLKESLGVSGVFVDYNDVAGYVEAIRSLDDQKLYDKHSKAAKKRSKEVSMAFAEQLRALDDFLQTIKYPSKR